MPGVDGPFFGPGFGVNSPYGDSSSSDSGYTSEFDYDSDEDDSRRNGDSTDGSEGGPGSGVPRLLIEDQLRNLPNRFKRDSVLTQTGSATGGLGGGVLQNNVDVVRATSTTETLDVPDRYTASIGVQNKWSNDLEADKTAYDGKKRKTFDINGKICITESVSGGICEKKFTAKDGAGKCDSENVVLVGNNEAGGGVGGGDFT